MLFKKAIFGFCAFLFLNQTDVSHGTGFSDPLEEIFRKVSIDMPRSEVERLIRKDILHTKFEPGTFSADIRNVFADFRWQGEDLLGEGEKPWSSLCMVFHDNRLVGIHYIFNYARKLVENRVKGGKCFQFE